MKLLDATYRRRALPPGSARHWSWLYAAPDMRAPLLGVYALQAEWSALTDPATQADVAYTKLGWWQEEINRLAGGGGIHPISRYLRSLPNADRVDFSPLNGAVQATAAELGGSPLERAADLESHAAALWSEPLAVAAGFVPGVTSPALVRSTRALAAAQYLSRALDTYRHDSHHGRVPFAIDELLAAAIENDDLRAAQPPPPLARYLAELRGRAGAYFELAGTLLPATARSRQRHILVLAALGARRLQARSPTLSAGNGLGWRDMLLAWTIARRAARNLDVGS